MQRRSAAGQDAPSPAQPAEARKLHQLRESWTEAENIAEIGGVRELTWNNRKRLSG
jgi:hypothetical protein